MEFKGPIELDNEMHYHHVTMRLDAKRPALRAAASDFSVPFQQLQHHIVRRTPVVHTGVYCLDVLYLYHFY